MKTSQCVKSFTLKTINGFRQTHHILLCVRLHVSALTGPSSVQYSYKLRFAENTRCYPDTNNFTLIRDILRLPQKFIHPQRIILPQLKVYSSATNYFTAAVTFHIQAQTSENTHYFYYFYPLILYTYPLDITYFTNCNHSWDPNMYSAFTDLIR